MMPGKPRFPRESGNCRRVTLFQAFLQFWGGTNGQSVGRRSHAEGNSLKSRVHSSKQDHDALSDRPYGTSSPRASNVPLVP